MARYDWEVARATGSLLDESDAPEPITLQNVRGTFQKSLDQARRYAGQARDSVLGHARALCLAVLGSASREPAEAWAGAK
ncbi:MAG: hypothetical protein ABW061_28455 [Polyangiaceae bacterium]